MNAREVKQANLEQQIERATANLRKQFEEYKEKGGGLLVIAGIAVAAYLLYRLLSSSDEDEVVSEPRQMKAQPQNKGYIKEAFMGVLGSVAIGFAREKLIELIETHLKNDPEGKEEPGHIA